MLEISKISFWPKFCFVFQRENKKTENLNFPPLISIYVFKYTFIEILISQILIVKRSIFH